MNTKLLRQKILDLAIHGKLVPQNPKDEPTSVLLEKIRAEKERLIKDGKIKHNNKSKNSAEKTIQENGPFGIPKCWKWCRIDDIGEVVTGNTPSKENLSYYGNEYPFYKPTDLEQGINTIVAYDNLSKIGFEKARQLPKNTILVTCIGATIGKTGLIKRVGTCNQQINAIIPKELILPELVYFICISNYFQNFMIKNASATTLPIINKSKFSEILIPLPPLSEQQRIVVEINRWFALIDQIEKSKTNIQNY
ncbi:MAG: restriction endonuclease subunit S, partial [Prevotella sp.]|nr:restriction endonuclease subunit S [Prevotella sp.]